MKNAIGIAKQLYPTKVVVDPQRSSEGIRNQRLPVDQNVSKSCAFVFVHVCEDHVFNNFHSSLLGLLGLGLCLIPHELLM